MILITIGSADKPLVEATPDWINQQINRRRADGGSVCVRIRIDEPGVVMSLSTPECPLGNSNTRGPNERERRVFELWKQHDLDKPDATGGAVVSFLNRLSWFIA
jgi:hypothetical protein